MRSHLNDFDLANSFYAGLVVTAWVVDPNTMTASATKATLYPDIAGERQMPNPVTLDSEGKWPLPVYVDQSVILEITGDSIPTHSTGVIPRLGYARGAWATATEYWPGDTATHDDDANIYQCQVAHVSGTFATDLTAGDWIKLVDQTAQKALIVAELVSEGVGLPEAPNDGNPYSRESLGWAIAPTKAEVLALEAAVGSLSGGILYVGNYNATAHTAVYTAVSGFSNGVLVAASAAANKYVIVTTAGTGAAPAPVVALAVGDYLISDGTNWNKVGVGGGTVAASAVSFTPAGGVSSTDVQAAIVEVAGDVTAEASTRAAAITTEAGTRAAADTAEATARAAADSALSTSITNAITTAEAYTDTKIAAFDAPADGKAYLRDNNAWVEGIQRKYRKVLGTSDTPTAANDKDGFIRCVSSSAVTITANDLGEGVSYSIQQAGTGQITVVAGAGVTLHSDKASPSFTSARQWAILTVVCHGGNDVSVGGNTA